MKHLFAIIIVLILKCNVYSQSISGWYEADVKYTNWSTGYTAYYTLDVHISYNQVDKISFGNGGYLCDVYCNGGEYFWSGGYISVRRYYNTITLSTSVTITDGNYRVFDIEIEL